MAVGMHGWKYKRSRWGWSLMHFGGLNGVLRVSEVNRQLSRLGIGNGYVGCVLGGCSIGGVFSFSSVMDGEVVSGRDFFACGDGLKNVSRVRLDIVVVYISN